MSTISSQRPARWNPSSTPSSPAENEYSSLFRYRKTEAAGTIGSSGGSPIRPMRTSASRTCRSFAASWDS